MTLALLIVAFPVTAGAEDVRVAIGHRAPDFTLRDLRGKPVQLSRLIGKNAVLLNFWATWCGPCRAEMPTMERAYQEYRAKGLEILAVSVDAGPEATAGQAVSRFMSELKLSFPALLDPEMKVLREYRVVGLPATFLIDRNGIFQGVDIGPRDWFGPGSRKRLESLLK